MNIFMIGGTGLLGCEAATQLIKMGHKVSSVALPPLPQGAPIPEEMEIVFGDINKKSDEEIEEMISEAKEEGTYEEMKEEIEADIKRAKYLQTISIRKTK